MDDPDHNPPGGFGVELPHLVGKTTEEATEMATEQGIKDVVVLQVVDGITVTTMTMDWNPNRLRLRVESGVVLSAVFG